MKTFLNHSLRYAAFFCCVFVLYATATGLEKPPPNAVMFGAIVIVGCVALGMVAEGIGRLFSARKNARAD